MAKKWRKKFVRDTIEARNGFVTFEESSIGFTEEK